MKKWKIVVLVILLLTTLLTVCVTGGFTKNLFTGKIYRPRNVYEEIWNMVVTEQHTRKQTVLTTSTEDAEADFDFGYHFVGVHIPECNMTIGWETTGEELFFSFPLGKGVYARFIYNYEAKTLYGNTIHSYLMDRFLTNYFEWCEAASDFSSRYDAKHLGDFAFRYGK